jgi:hypothetical protein
LSRAVLWINCGKVERPKFARNTGKNELQNIVAEKNYRPMRMGTDRRKKERVEDYTNR